jgi:hypothetical protein
MLISAVNELKFLVDRALKETEDRLQQHSSYGPYVHAKTQLLFIKDKLETPDRMNDEAKKEIKIGRAHV